MTSYTKQYTYNIDCYKVLDYAPMGISIFDKDFNIVFWNKCLAHWTKIEPDRIIGQNIFKKFPTLDTISFKTRVEHLFKGGPPTLFSSHLHKKTIPCKLSDGSDMVQETIVSAIPSEKSGVFFALMAIKNVTELTKKITEYREMRNQAMEEVKLRKKIEADLRESNKTILEHQNITIKQEKLKVLLEMAGATAHELNQPLMTLLGNIELMNMTEEVTETQSNHLKNIEQAGKRISSIVSKIQKIRRYEAKKYLSDSSIIDFDLSSMDTTKQSSELK